MISVNCAWLDHFRRHAGLAPLQFSNLGAVLSDGVPDPLHELPLCLRQVSVECVHELAFVPAIALQHLLQIALIASVQRGGQELFPIPLLATPLARQLNLKRLVQVSVGVLE